MNTLLLLAGIHLMGLVSPGPDVFLLLRYGMKKDIWHAVMCAFGITLGIVTHLLLLYLGISFLIRHSPLAYNIVVVLGALWLLKMALTILFSTKDASALDTGQKSSHTYTFSFVQGYMTNLLNPKAFVYFTSIIAPFLRQSSQGFLPIFFVLVGMSLLWFLSLAYCLKFPCMQRYTRTYSKPVEKVLGIILFLLAIFILQSFVF